MNIVVLVGGQEAEGNVEHRYLVDALLDRFDHKISHIIMAGPVRRPWWLRLQRMVRRGHWIERLRRRLAGDAYGPSQSEVSAAMQKIGVKAPSRMPGGNRVCRVDSHNGEDCLGLLERVRPDLIVVYGTAIISDVVASQASFATLNMHTGLSPWYRGDSTLFWPVYYDQEDKLGVTVHRLTADVDGGDIVETAPVVYEAGDTEADLFAKGVRVGTHLYVKAIAAAIDGTLSFHAQDLTIGREFSWRDRTLAAERVVKRRLKAWAEYKRRPLERVA